jgi:Tol biopolymer transport system component
MIPAGSAGQVLTSYNIFDLQDVSEVAVSPDQQHIAYTVNIPRPFSDTAGTDYRELYVYNVSSGEITPLLTGKSRIFSINWTPEGKVSFRYAGEEARGLQVFSIDPLGGEPVQLTRFERSVGQYEFSDNKPFFLLRLPTRTPVKSQLLEKGFNAEVYEEEFSDINLYKYDLQTHETKQVTTGVTVYDFSVSPDGRFAAAAIAEKNLVDYSYMFKRIFLVDLETGEKSLLVDNPGKLGGISWSPDGKRIAFIAASDINDAVAGSMFVADVPNNQPFEG